MVDPERERCRWWVEKTEGKTLVSAASSVDREHMRRELEFSVTFGFLVNTTYKIRIHDLVFHII